MNIVSKKNWIKKCRLTKSRWGKQPDSPRRRRLGGMEARRNAEIPIKEQIPFFCMMASRYPKYILIYGVVVAGVLYNCIDSNFIPPNGMLFTFFYKQLHWIPQRAEPEPIPHTPYLHWILSVAKLPPG